MGIQIKSLLSLRRGVLGRIDRQMLVSLSLLFVLNFHEFRVGKIYGKIFLFRRLNKPFGGLEDDLLGLAFFATNLQNYLVCKSGLVKLWFLGGSL